MQSFAARDIGRNSCALRPAPGEFQFCEIVASRARSHHDEVISLFSIRFVDHFELPESKI
jgi:hypothetical protein